ncbi:MAG: 3,4-dihydroxy-2-butanone 4-phosphate synthase [Thermoplasmatales archaeon SG8-52-3]|nr:MAG: 3,4-dihydroxy-2-butanone 4-phosphate synthase [Thermoplasmatales archaeon SG8-52-3]
MLIGVILHLGEFIDKIKQAISDLQKGKFILIFDDDSREAETDLVIASEFVTPNSIKTMRKDGGGLIFLMVSKEIANKLQLPFLADMYSNIENKYPLLKKLVPNDIPYDAKSSFSLYINHRNTFTGITDNDRSLTMKKFAELAKNIQSLNDGEAINMFGKEFRSPGHVPICIAAKNLLKERKGHTELVVSIIKMAGLTPVGSGCEIMGDNGKALSKEKVKSYAKNNNLIFLEGSEIVKAWNNG